MGERLDYLLEDWDEPAPAEGGWRPEDTRSWRERLRDWWASVLRWFWRGEE